MPGPGAPSTQHEAAAERRRKYEERVRQASEERRKKAEEAAAEVKAELARTRACVARASKVNPDQRTEAYQKALAACLAEGK